jgi:hypothetical protein
LIRNKTNNEKKFVKKLATDGNQAKKY